MVAAGCISQIRDIFRFMSRQNTVFLPVREQPEQTDRRDRSVPTPGDSGDKGKKNLEKSKKRRKIPRDNPGDVEVSRRKKIKKFAVNRLET